MSQGPLAGINTRTSILPAAATPLDLNFLVEVQPSTNAKPYRQKVTLAALATAVGGTPGTLAVGGNLQLGGYLDESIAVGLTAIGTNRGNSLALTKQINIIATAASAAVGVALPAASVIGVGGWVDVYNDGPGNAFHVYAAGGDTIDGTAGATGVNLTNGFWCRYVVTAAGAFVSYRNAITRSA